MLKITKGLVFVAALLASFHVAAQGRIAVVNIETAILSTDSAQTTLKALADKPDFKERKEKFEDLLKKYEEEAAAFQKDSAVLTDEQKASKIKALKDQEDEIKLHQTKLQEAQQLEAQMILRNMSQATQEVLRDLITTESIGLLLPANAVMHADNSYNITAKLTDKLNQKLAEASAK